MPRDEVHGEEEDEQESETKNSFPADALEGRDLVLLDDLLLHGHLNGSDTLRENDEQISGEDHLLGHPSSAALLEENVVSNAYDHQTQDDHNHARPLEPLEPIAEEPDREDACEDDHAAPEHLKAGGIRPGQSQVHGGSAGKVTRSWDGPHQRVELLGAE